MKEIANMMYWFCVNVPIRCREWRTRRSDLIDQLNSEFAGRD